MPASALVHAGVHFPDILDYTGLDPIPELNALSARMTLVAHLADALELLLSGN